MNNCLVTKLKAVVENDNLVKVGELRFKILGNHLLKIGTTEYPVATEMSILDTYPNVVFTDNNERTISIDHLERDRTASADCEIAIKDKYKIAGFIADGNSPTEFNIDDFQFCPIKNLVAYSGIDGSTGKIVGHFSRIPTSVIILNIYSKGIKFDDFPELPLLTEYEAALDTPVDINTIITKCPSLQNIIAFYGNINGNIETLPTRTEVSIIRLEQRGSVPNNVTGDIVSLGGWVKLTTLKINGTAISGTLESFCDAQKSVRANGDTITFTGNGIVTYQGTAIAKDAAKTITFDGQGGYSIA